MGDPRDGATEPLRLGTEISATGRGVVLAERRLSVSVVSGPDEGRRWDVRGSRLRIGAAAGNDVQLADTTVSRHHAEIRAETGRYVLRDLGSTNGTRLDGASIIEAWLEDGAQVRVGKTELRFGCAVDHVALEESDLGRFGQLEGSAPAMRRLFGLLERIAPTKLGVIVLGETGTGKDLLAHAIHAKSTRAAQPFVVVDCGALSRTLIESDLFGHERGAFTGAERARAGAFERAAGGTLFLDELGELPMELQPKLLRALEQGEVQRLGGSQVIDVDVRVIAATHRDVEGMVRRGELREDLYYRLAEVVVAIPPLRERRDDIPVLARALLADWAEETAARTIADDAMAVLRAREWPGNVRELRNVIRRAAALARGSTIEGALLSELDEAARGSGDVDAVVSPTPLLGEVPVCDHLGIREARQEWARTLERAYLTRMRERFGQDVDAMAAHMGLLRKSVLRLLREHGFPVEP
jgi:DNA-binding NtrC family response regulator